MRTLAVAWTLALAATAAQTGAARAADGGVTSREIRLGQTIALSGGTIEHGKAVALGARILFDKVNAAGGIHGRRIVLQTVDDGGDAGRAAENTRRFIEQEDVLALFGGIEGGPCTASLKAAVEREVPLVACMAGAPELREPFNRLVLPVRAPHYNEFERLIDTALQFGMRRIGFVHADSENGRKHLANVRKLLAARQLELGLAIPLSSAKGSEANAARIAQDIVDAKLDAVFNHGAYGTYAQIIRETKKRGAATQFMAINSGAQQLVHALGAQAQGLIFTQVVPFPWVSTPPVVKEYREALKQAAPDAAYSFSGLEGYISAKVLVEALRQAGPKLTRGRLVEAFEEMGARDVGGFSVSYSGSSRQGSNFVDTVVATRDGRFVH